MACLFIIIENTFQLTREDATAIQQKGNHWQFEIGQSNRSLENLCVRKQPICITDGLYI